MTFDSVYEMFNPLTDVRKQHFWHWFSGKKLNSGGEDYYSSTTENGSSQCNLSHSAYLYSFGRQVQSAEAGVNTTKISFYLKAPSATDYDLRVVVYTSGGSVRDTSNTVDASTLSTTGGWVDFDGLDVTLNAGDYTMMEVFGSTNSNGVYVFRDGSVSGDAYESQNGYTNFSSHGTKATCKYSGSQSGRWIYTDRNSSNHTGSGMVDEVDGGFKLVGNSSGANNQQTLIGFNDKKEFSNTGSVVIWVAKMTATGTNKQGGWGMCGTMPNYWLNGMKINIATGGTAIDFYTMNNSTENNSGSTDLNSSLSPSDWQTYKLEQLSSSAICSINGVEESIRTTYLSSTAMQPFVYSKYDDSAVQVRYCEAYNT